METSAISACSALIVVWSVLPWRYLKRDRDRFRLCGPIRSIEPVHFERTPNPISCQILEDGQDEEAVVAYPPGLVRRQRPACLAIEDVDFPADRRPAAVKNRVREAPLWGNAAGIVNGFRQKRCAAMTLSHSCRPGASPPGSPPCRQGARRLHSKSQGNMIVSSCNDFNVLVASRGPGHLPAIGLESSRTGLKTSIRRGNRRPRNWCRSCSSTDMSTRARPLRAVFIRASPPA